MGKKEIGVLWKKKESGPLAGEFCGKKGDWSFVERKKKETGPLAGEFCGRKGDWSISR